MIARKEKANRKTDKTMRQICFSKEKILAMAQYVKWRDLLSVLLTEEKTYTKAEVEQMIEKFMKGKVE